LLHLSGGSQPATIKTSRELTKKALKGDHSIAEVLKIRQAGPARGATASPD